MSNSSEWYTCDYIWDKVNATYNGVAFDPFPPNGSDGYDIDWTGNVYCNPPIPASKTAIKAIETYKSDKSVNIIFTGYSESVIWQVPQLETYIHVKCYKRINWIDSRKEVNGVSNPNYLQPGRNPAHYSSFFLTK